MKSSTRRSGWKRLFVMLLAGLAAMNLAVLWNARDHMFRGFGDFTAFYTAGKILQRGQSARLYDRDLELQIQQEFAPTVENRHHSLPFIRPPFQALLFLPLAYLKHNTACLVWMGAKLAVLFLVPFLLQPCLPGQPLLSPRLFGPLCLAVTPVAADLLQGQDAILFMLFVALAFRALCRQSDVAAGLFLGLGLFKFHLILPIVLVLAFRRKGNVILSFAATALVLAVISGLIVGWQSLVHYPVFLWSLARTPNSGIMDAPSMPNLRGFFSIFPGHLEARTMLFWLPSAVAGTVLAARAWPEASERKLQATGFSLCLVAVILVTFYFSGYDMMLLLLPVFVLGHSFLGPELPVWCKFGFFGGLAALLLFPESWLVLLDIHETRWMTPVLFLLAAVLVTASRVWSLRTTHEGPPMAGAL
jgi:Glycosyltransferase family 87